MSTEESTNVTSVKEVDYLDEDKPIRGQNFVLLSFLSVQWQKLIVHHLIYLNVKTN